MDVRLEQIGNYAVMIMEKLVIVEKKKIQRQKRRNTRIKMTSSILT